MFDVFKTPEFKKALRFYIEEVKNNRKHFLISMFSAIIWCFLVILHPYLIKRIVDDGIVASNQQVIIVFLSFLIAIGYVRAASIGVRRYFSMSVSFNVEAEIRNTIFGHMQRLAFKYHDKVPTGELMARASSDASQVRLAFAIAPLATANVFLLLLLSVTLVSIDFILGLIVLLSIPLVLYIAGNFASRAMEVSLKVKEAEAEMTTEVEEQLGGIRVVKVFKNAKIKLFIDANIEIRAKRRHKQLIEQGEKSIYSHILKDLKLRDKTDINRKESPLRIPVGAIIIDNSKSFIKTKNQINKALQKI